MSGFPQPNLMWTFNNNPVDSDKITVAETYSTLSLSRVTPEVSGQYTVTAENKAGKASLSFKISVISKYLSCP